MSDTNIMPEFDDLADVFWRLGIMQSPSELHGRLVGLLAVREKISEQQWLEHARAFLDPVGKMEADDVTVLLVLLKMTQSQMTETDLDFSLLLPDDQVDILQRVDALSSWCLGFLAGFVMAGKERQQVGGQQHYSAEISEALSDMAAISQASVEGEEADIESSEHDYFQLTEYLRIAALNISLECKQAISTPPSNTNDSSPMTSPAGLFKNKPLH